MEWQKFYLTLFGIRIDAKIIKLPARKSDFDRLIIVAKGIAPNRVYATCEKHFSCMRSYNNLDRDVPINDRMPKQTYAVASRNEIESDRQYKNMCADDLIKKNIRGATLLEHMLFCLKHFWETGNHLDRRDITMCSGSRYKDGRVPTTISDRGVFKIHWCSRHDRYPRLRVREVIL